MDGKPRVSSKIKSSDLSNGSKVRILLVRSGRSERSGFPKRPLVSSAAKVPNEPTSTNAAGRTNVRTSRRGQKRDKIKVSFAKSLCHKNFQ